MKKITFENKSLSSKRYQDTDVCAVPTPKFILIGMGPYTKRHYFNQFLKHNFFPDLIVDLEGNKAMLSEFLESHNVSIPLYCLPESERDAETLPEYVKYELNKFIREHDITHAIIATEPKAHLAYLDFFIENGIHVLVEKPLTAPQKSSFSSSAALKIEKDYQYLMNKIKQSPNKNLRVDLHCHRRHHPIYQFVTKQIEMIVAEFDIPLTFCDVYHCDGMWNMPDEYLTRENHPYKYGYGKLLHSGYHFIDLLSGLIKTCYRACSKVPDEAEIYAVPFSPLDSLGTFNQEDYRRFFQNDKTNNAYNNPQASGFGEFGELDFHSIMQLFQKGKRLTTCALNLLQTGLSHRAWNTLPQDTYHSNGRIRHERINLQCGMLFNIQVHSYPAHESRDRSNIEPPAVGGNMHFDVNIYRNSRLIGGEPFTHLNSEHFLPDSKSNFNEVAREKCLVNFLFGGPSVSPLKDHALGIRLLSHSLQALCESNKGRTPIKRFAIREKDL